MADFARHLAGVATEKETPMKQVHVYPTKDDDGWTVKAVGFATQEDAINWARPASHHIGGELVISGENGQIREKDSHGNDPKETRG